MQKVIAAAAVAAVATLAGAASAQLYISEVYAGLPNQDGTEDWFEITNLGASAVSTAGLFYDDTSPNLAQGGDLDDVLIGAGESVVFVISSDAAAIAEFQSIWGSSARVFLSNGGGGLGQGGDQVTLFSDAGGGALNILSSVVYGVNDTGLGLSTLDVAPDGSFVQSALGVNGAFASNAFENDFFGGPIQLIGSPGAIPAPGAVALLGLGGLLAGRRRR